MNATELAVPRFPWKATLVVAAAPVLIATGAALVSINVASFGDLMPVLLPLLAIAAGTFVSEDLTCIAVGLLIREGRVSWLVGLTGRFDVRYSDPGEFKAGRDLAIVELNGVTSESTNIYDPSRSLLSAYRTLYCQWELLYGIGAANRARGHRPASAWVLLTQVISYYSQRKIEPLAD